MEIKEIIRPFLEQLVQDSTLVDSNVIDFSNKAFDCINLYARKNHDYGNSFDKGFKDIGFPYAVGRIYDKTNRLVNLSKNTSDILTKESIEDTLKDLACYSIMTLVSMNKEMKETITNIDLE